MAGFQLNLDARVSSLLLCVSCCLCASSCVHQAYAWQGMLARFLVGTEADDRTIVWIHDSAGNRGKSKLVKWLISNAGAITVPNDYKNTARRCYELQLLRCVCVFCGGRRSSGTVSSSFCWISRGTNPSSISTAWKL